jgi:hypothetical protein
MSERMRECRNLRSLKLKREGDLVEQNRRDGNHEQKKCPRKQKGAIESPSQEEQNQAGEQKHERKAGQKQLGAKLPQHKKSHRQRQHERTGPRRTRRNGGETSALLPNHESREQRDEESVGEVRVVPPLADQMGQSRPIEPKRKRGQNGKLPRRKQS